jgi:hypothetical protein
MHVFLNTKGNEVGRVMTRRTKGRGLSVVQLNDNDDRRSTPGGTIQINHRCFQPAIVR